ncbi:MAG TPA: leucyl aminopeptidase [Acidimicrobiales bacterium]|nr:leucyl aminopeptidase [Acidimicrobiales bacterium]
MSISVELASAIPADAAIAVLVTTEFASTTALDPIPLKSRGFEAKRDELCSVQIGDRPGLAMGIGPVSDISPETLRHAAGGLARAAFAFPSVAIEIPAWLVEGVNPHDAVAALTEGFILGAYEFTAFKSVRSRRRLHKVVLAAEAEGVAQAIARGTIIASAACLARDLVNEPGGSLTPERFATRASEEGQRHGFGVTVWAEDTIREQRLGGLLGVNRGSALPPRLVELSYDPGGVAQTVALCGKGVTFDSGGLSLKKTEGMVAMKGDMAGAAAVLAAFVALSALRPTVKVRGFLPLTDNMPGPDATRVGDVLTIRNGRTVEVLNTDAEGRLILADALALASEGHPDAIIDLATLTGACIAALGDRIAGLMGNDPKLIEKVKAAGAACGEAVWPLPLPDGLRRRLDSTVADLRNVAEKGPGASLAALFLREFVGEGIPWVHLDIAGPAKSDDNDGELTEGGTGFGVRLLVQLLEEWDGEA